MASTTRGGEGADERPETRPNGHPETPPESPPRARRPAASSPIGRAVAGGQEVARHTVEGVVRERLPRPLVVRYARHWLIGYAVVLAAVVALALAARAFSVLPGDLPFTRELQENRSPLVFWPMYLISYLGFPFQSAIIFVLVALALWAVRLRLEAGFLVLTLLADGLAALIKLLVGRERPSSGLVHVAQALASPSFPSGHTVHYVVFYGFLAYVIVTNFRDTWARRAVLGVCVVLIVLVGPSRVYLGEHWPTDVIGGYLIGALCLLPLIAGYVWTKERFVVVPSYPWLRRRDAPIGG